MLDRLSFLALEVTYLDRAWDFYGDRLGLDVVAETPRELRFRAGDTDLVCRRPRQVPRGGLHVHYAFTTPAGELDAWREHLADLDPEEVTFGTYTSLYVDDPDDHCVEIGGIDGESGEDETAARPEAASNGDRPDLTGIFEVVLEVEDLSRAEDLYTRLGFEVVDRGEERKRVRLGGPFDLELWEPQLGLADARGGVHVDLGIVADDPMALVDTVEDVVTDVEIRSEGIRFRDPDGHWITLLEDAD